MRLLNHSVVIVAQAHNPSILNPDFLAIRSIVPESWGWELGAPVVCTPPLAQVPYVSGVSLICDPNKLQIIDAGQKIDPQKSKVRHIAEAYVATLPHVPYTSCGVNFTAAFEAEDPEGLLIDRFLTDGPWKEPPDHLSAIGLRLNYPLEGGYLRVSLDSAEIEEATSETPGGLRVVVVGGNFHHNCTGADRPEQLVQFLRGTDRYWNKFSEMAERLTQGA